ncbi:MAG: hypothetical protein ACW97X_12975 [Candidatus Hodarchaeales archaeon]
MPGISDEGVPGYVNTPATPASTIPLAIASFPSKTIFFSETFSKMSSSFATAYST